MTSSPRTVDVMLVGAGPIGLELAVNLRSAGIDYVHLDASQIGHTISWYPRQSHFFSSPERISICGVPLMTADQSKATREEYLAYLIGVARQFEIPVNTYERVKRVVPVACRDQFAASGEPSRFLIETESREGESQYHARSVILAIGDMHHPRPLQHAGADAPVPGSDQSHVSHYFTEPHAYANQRLLIVGGKNSAAEAALRCYRLGAKVTLCQRQPELSSSIKYWIKPELEWLIRAGEIAFLPSTVPIRIGRSLVRVADVDGELRPLQDPARQRELAADFVLLLIGYTMDSRLLANAGVDLWGPGDAPTVNPATMETNVPGLYVAGTAAAGTQLSFKLFIENCHAHVVRIVRHLTGRDPKHVNPLALSRLDEHAQPEA